MSESQFAFLRSIDTPTVCNLIEIVAPERRGAGYTVSHLHCPFPDLPPMVGFAKTCLLYTSMERAFHCGAIAQIRQHRYKPVIGFRAESLWEVKDIKACSGVSA